MPGGRLDNREDFYLPEEVVEWIGLKKSELLTILIEKMKDDDYGFEEFQSFDHLLPQTIEAPDRAFEEKNDDFPIRTCIRTWPYKTQLHQIIIGAIIPDKNSLAEVFVPILSFVTKKDSVVKEFCRGQIIDRPPLN